MRSPVRALETTGKVDENGELKLDEPLTTLGQGPVRVILLLPENGDPGETEWLEAAMSNPAFDFLADSAENIYTPADGKPFVDQG